MPLRPDALSAVMPVRRIEVETARRRLAERLACAARAEALGHAARESLVAEARAASDRAAFAAWAPRALAERDRTAVAFQCAEGAVVEAQTVVAAARAGERLAQCLSEQRKEAARQRAARRTLAALMEAECRRASRGRV